MTMKKVSKSTWVFLLIGLIILIGAGIGVNHFINHINGTTKAQIESRERAIRAADQTSRELNNRNPYK